MATKNEETKISEKVIKVLHSSTTSSVMQEKNQRVVMDLLEAKKYKFEKIDGSNKAFKELRTMLWGISGKKAVYPQVFIYRVKDELYEFAGTSKTLVDDAIEDGTFDDIFKDCEKLS